jgi:hypothetical protein
MLRGIVKFRARIVDVDKEVTFPLVEFNPNEPGIEKVGIEGPNGKEILTAVHLNGVDSPTYGIAIATKVHIAALDRISFFQSIPIENGHVTEQDFSPIDPPPPGEFHINAGPGHLSLVGKDATFRLGLSAAHLKTELEQVSPPGERNFRLFRSARQSTSPVEEFMHLYNLLLMFFDDDRPGAQGRLDEFIRREEPGVASTPHPRRPNVDETLYTRLRNELGHNRKGVNLDTTKAEMRKNLGGLIALSKRAIELHS